MDSITEVSEFIIVGVHPVVFGKKFRGFKYKAVFPDRTSRWIVREDYKNFDSQPMIEEVHRAIEINLQSYGEPQL